MITLYGIPNCDTVKKACKWLQQHNIEFKFHDFRQHGCDAELLDRFFAHIGWQTVLNKRSTSWKNLDENVRNSIDEQQAHALILENPTLIKRPVLEYNKGYQIGFKADDYTALFKH